MAGKNLNLAVCGKICSLSLSPMPERQHHQQMSDYLLAQQALRLRYTPR
jgi:hypothetical protein